MINKHSTIKSLTIMFLLFGNSIVRADQLLSFEWSRAEDYLQGQTQRFEFKPDIYGIYYSLALADVWQASVSYWQGGATRKLGEGNFHLENEQSGLAFSLFYSKENWGLSSTISFSENTIDVESPDALSFYESQSDTDDISVAVDYAWRVDALEVRPSLGMGYQKSESRSRAFGISLPGLTLSRDESQKSIYGFAGMSLSYWLSISDTLACLPAVHVSWTESLDGEASLTDNRTLQTRRGGTYSAQQQSVVSVGEDGAGYVDLSLSLLWQSWQLRLAYGQSFAQEEDLATSSLQVGLSF